MNKIWIFIYAFIAPFFLWAQDVAGPVVPTVTVPPVVDPTQDFIQLLLNSIGGMKGASTLAIVAVVIKILLKLLDVPYVADLMGKKFSDWSGGLKLTLVLGLSYVGGVVALMLPPTSLTIGAALVHSTTLAAFLVLTNQIYKHYIEKKPTP